MSMPTEYVDLLNGLNKEVRDKQPRDVKQFCANYFLNLLEEDRRLWVASKAGHHHNDDPAATTTTATTTAGAAAPVSTEALTNKAGAPTFSRFNTSSFRTSGGENPDPHHKHDTNDDEAAAAASAASPSHNEHNNSQSKTRINNHHHIGDSQSAFPINFNANRRTSVSAESMNPGAISEAMTHISPGKQLPPEQLARLNKSVASNFLFANLDEEALHSVLQSLQEKTVAAGSTIIKQGDEGDFFYIVESGTVDFFRDGEKVATSGAGSSFGELALMYNAPRAATVVATTECVLWALDRVTFRRILLEKTFSKRSMYEDFLREVPLLKVLNKYELSKLSDALNCELYEPGQAIVKEGDAGEEFFIIEHGTADVAKEGEGVVKKLSKGDYFGEVALLNDTPRQATVIATSKLKVVTLGKSAFQRLLGQAVNVLKRDDPTQPHH